MRTVSRQGKSFQIIDKRYNDWDFWGAFANESWESRVLAEVEKTQGLLFDIGAWVGPISMWAASKGIRCIAVEPDPVAVEDLMFHVRTNGYQELITIVEAALTADPGLVKLNIQNGGGDSQSSISRTNMEDSIQVESVSIQKLMADYGYPDLIKMDIEGFESVIMPSIGPTLRELGIPVLLSLHWGFMPPESHVGLEIELAEWDCQPVENDTFLFTPKRSLVQGGK